MNINRMIKRMRAYDEMAKEIRLDVIRSQGSYDPTRSKGKGRGFRVLVPKVVDVVMVYNKDKFNDCKYGVVVEIVSDQSIMVKYQSGKIEKIATKLAIPLVGECY